MPNAIISNALQHCQNYCSDVYPSSPQPRYPGQALWRSEGCIFFSPSLCVPPVPIHIQKKWHLSTAAENKVQHRWAPRPPGSFCGHCRGRDLGETELKTLKNSTCCYILLVPGADCPCASGEQVSLDRPKHTIPRHPRLTAPPAAGLCICWRRCSSWWCSEGLSWDLGTRACTSKHATCSLRCYFATPKLHYYGNEADSSARLKNSRKSWAVGGLFCWFFLNVAVLEMTDAEII